MGSDALLLAALGGLLVGFLLTAFGGGGSVLAMPWLVFVVGIADTHVAIGTSAAAVALNAAFGLAGHARAGRVKWPCASVFGISGVAGAFAGARLARHVDGGMLLSGFALMMIAIALSMTRRPRSEGDPAARITPPMVLKLAPLGLGAGVASGFFGIGGGFLIAPGLMAASGMTLAHAAASSLLSVALFGAATSFSYALAGMIDWPVLAALLAGGAGGIAIGLPAARRLAARVMLARRAFALLVIAVAFSILLR